MNFEGIIGGNSRLNKGVTKIALIFFSGLWMGGLKFWKPVLRVLIFF